LRPGGRVAIAVWGPRARNPWLGAIFDVVSAHFGTPLPPPGMPHPFSIDDAGRLARLLTDAGLKDVEVGELSTPCEVATADEWWERSCALAGPLAQKLASLPADARLALAARAAEAVRVFETPVGLKIPGVTLLASAHHLPIQFDTI
jgi:sugar phosphate isomerase/epimerase